MSSIRLNICNVFGYNPTTRQIRNPTTRLLIVVSSWILQSNYETDTQCLQSSLVATLLRGYYSAYSRLWSLRFLVATLLRGYYNFDALRFSLDDFIGIQLRDRYAVLTVVFGRYASPWILQNTTENDL